MELHYNYNFIPFKELKALYSLQCSEANADEKSS